MDIVLSPIRILDSGKIKEKAILANVTDDVSSFIRAILSDPKRKYFVSSFRKDSEETVFGVLGLENISGRNRRAEAVMYFACGEDEERCVSAYDQLLRYAFFEMQLHRISVLVPATDEFTASIVENCHMRQEALLEEAVRIGDAYYDAALYALLDSEYPDYSVGFVAFKKGLIAIRGDNDVVEMTRFYAYGQTIEETLERNVAIHIGIADEKGVIKQADAPEYKDLLKLDFPNEVKRCMQEFTDYFSKRRTSFTIHSRPLHVSDFQKKVWDKVLTIPYGVTCSYEDIAMSLTGGDKIAARNLTRAVGAACGDNPLPLLVPCHRIIGKDGRLVGFSGGLEFKEYLLNHEMFGIHIC